MSGVERGGISERPGRLEVSLKEWFRPDDSWHDDDGAREVASWRMKERMKTVQVALVLCLNIGTDPPDVVKTTPCAREECWVDPLSLPEQKALEQIGYNLQRQYEQWQPKARYRKTLDPTVEDVKRLCQIQRRNARDERVLFHFNGHGVPRPTKNGEIWVFNKTFTQYIPLSLYELQGWLEHPSIYVFDCSGAAMLLPFFQSYIEQKEAEIMFAEAQQQSEDGLSGSPGPSKVSGGKGKGSNQRKLRRLRDCIVLCATEADGTLPTSPEFPADIFSACLTTPVKIALRWFMKRNPLSTHRVTTEMLDRIPGQLNDRKTVLGELNWVFTAITDTIAWNSLPCEQFQRLFRQDLLVASLFRNFLLAERIMHSVNCTPVSRPRMPPTSQHPLWDAWDLATETCLSKLPALLSGGADGKAIKESLSNIATKAMRGAAPSPHGPIMFERSSFFGEQLTAFEVWLRFASPDKGPPEQLPIVLQVLLSQIHRVRALVLLAKFLDLGPWAVNHALSVGIFPYVLRLLQSPANDLRELLIFIWLKLLFLDSSCQVDLVKDNNGYVYFIKHLRSASAVNEVHPVGTRPVGGDGWRHEQSAYQRVMACAILSAIMHKYRNGQRVCLHYQLHAMLAPQLVAKNALLRRWLCICMGKLWDGFDEAKRIAIRDQVPERLFPLLSDSYPAVRASCVYALSALFGAGGASSAETDMRIMEEIRRTRRDCSTLVRSYLLLAMARLFFLPHHAKAFQVVAKSLISIERQHRRSSSSSTESSESAPEPPGAVSKLSINVASANVKSGLQRGPGTPRIRAGDSDAAAEAVASIEASIGDKKLSTAYIHMWQTVRNMQLRDPFGEASRLAGILVHEIHAGMVAQSPSTSSEAPKDIPAGSDASDSGRSLSRSFKRKDLSRISRMLGRSKSSSNFEGFRSVDPPGASGDTNSRGGSGHGRMNSREAKRVDEAKSSSASIASTLSALGLDHDKLFTQSSRRFSKPMIHPEEDSSKVSNRISSNSLIIRLDVPDASKVFADPLDPIEAANRWKVKRNEKIRQAARALGTSTGIEDKKSKALKLEQSAILDNESEMSSLLLFHPYEPVLVVADARNGIKAWNYEEGEKIAVFSNRNQPGSRITALSWINEKTDALLLTGSDDGAVRVWCGTRSHESTTDRRAQVERDGSKVEPDSRIGGSEYHSKSTESDPVDMVTAWLAVPDLFPGTRGSGLVVETWDNDAGLLYAGGMSSQLRLWDIEYQSCLSCICASSETCITTMTQEHATNGLLAGFGDGVMKLFDSRLPSDNAAVKELRGHEAWIVSVHSDSGGPHEVISGAVSGDINFWDLRAGDMPLRTVEAHRTPMTALAVHDHAPLLASGSHNQFIKVIETKGGTTLNPIRYHDGFLAMRIGPVSCLAFHPHRVVLAAGATDSIIAIYSSKGKF